MRGASVLRLNAHADCSGRCARTNRRDDQRNQRAAAQAYEDHGVDGVDGVDGPALPDIVEFSGVDESAHRSDGVTVLAGRDGGAADDPPPLATGIILVPASPAVEAATAEQKHNDDDDENSLHIRISPLTKALLVHTADQGAESIAHARAEAPIYFFRASRTASLTPPMAFCTLPSA